MHTVPVHTSSACAFACCRFKPSLDLLTGVSMGHLKETKQGDLLTGFQSLFAGSAPASAAAGWQPACGQTAAVGWDGVVGVA